MKQSYDEYADSDEDQHDAYLERMKEEGKIREENANDSSDGSGEETGEGRGQRVRGAAGRARGSCPPALVTSCLSSPRCELTPALCFQMSPSTPGRRTMTWPRSEWRGLGGERRAV